MALGKVKNKSERRSFRVYYSKHKDAFTAAGILSPMILWWIIVCGFPLAFGFVLGFFEMRGVAKPPVFNNLENFKIFFTESKYLRDLWNTVWIGSVSTVLTTVCGLAVAVLLNAVGRGKGAYRSVWYLPSITATVAVAQIIGILFDPINGALNQIRISQGLPTLSVDTDYGLAIGMIFLFSVWKSVGSTAIVWLAGLQAVDRCQYEAAEVDGAGGWQKFLHVTLPGLKPIATYIIITGIIGALQIYEPVAFITNGGPMEKTNVLVLRIIQDGYFNFDFGMAGASSLVLAAIVISASLVYYSSSRENDMRSERRAAKRIARRVKEDV